VDTKIIEISVKGKWVPIRALTVNELNIVTTGRLIRIASVHDEWWMERELEHPDAIIECLHDQAAPDFKADVFTFAQRLPSIVPKYSYPMEFDSIAAIRLTSASDWWQKLPQEARKNTRRAAKRGVVISVRPFDDQLVREIVQLNNSSPLRQGREFTHYGKNIDQVKRDHAAFEDRSEFICAFVGSQLIGFLKIVYCDGIGAILQLTTNNHHFDKRPANALVAAAVERCEKRGMGFVTYGKYRYGKQESTSLMDFKARNGFEEILVPRYYVPLTLRGKIGLRLGLHHDLVGVLPPFVATVGRRVRSTWHGWKQGSVTTPRHQLPLGG
jgi:hypothetical protein